MLRALAWVLSMLVGLVPIDGAMTPSREGVAEFRTAFEAAEPGEVFMRREWMMEQEPDWARCYNVTPADVAGQSDFQLFKFADTGDSFALIDGEVLPVCMPFLSGYGLIDAIPCDYDGDGQVDLLYTTSFGGSGVYYYGVFAINGRTKEYVPCYLWYDFGNPVFHRARGRSGAVVDVFDAEIDQPDHDYTRLSWRTKARLGSIFIEDGVPVFRP